MLGGGPSDPNVRRGWLQRLPEGERNNAKDQRLTELIEQAIAEGKTADEAGRLSLRQRLRARRQRWPQLRRPLPESGHHEAFSIALGGGHLKACG
jgi:hypothetical protein